MSSIFNKNLVDSFKLLQDVLEDWSQDWEAKKKYLTGRRVDLAEELSEFFYITVCLPC